MEACRGIRQALSWRDSIVLISTAPRAAVLSSTVPTAGDRGRRAQLSPPNMVDAMQAPATLTSPGPMSERSSRNPARNQKPAQRTPRSRGHRRTPNPVSHPPIEGLTIERIVGDGKGIGFHDGNTVFVPQTAPGDVIRANVTSKRGNVIQATVDTVVTPSPQRVDAPCPYYDRCGGCDFQHFSYEDQLATKVGMIQESLRRIAKLDPAPDIAITPSETPLGYRSRAEWQVNARNEVLGYFAANSHTVIDIAECPILTPELNDNLVALRDDLEAGLIPRQNNEYRAVSGDTGNVVETTGAPRSRHVMRTVGDDLYRFSAECFFQPNIPIAKEIRDHVARIGERAVDADAGGLALDLYCGVGLFTLPLARQFGRVIGVEAFAPAVKFANENLNHAELDNVRIVEAPVEQWIKGDRSPLGRFGFVVFDPPRSGAGPDVIEGILRLRPEHIAAVSCDPATFSRDIRGLLDRGYELMEVQAYDMFPQTHHVELVAHLRRTGA